MARWKRGEMASETLDARDIRSINEAFGPEKERCICGRLKAQGYVCTTCEGNQEGHLWGDRDKWVWHGGTWTWHKDVE